jgi:hypothetical protein
VEKGAEICAGMQNQQSQSPRNGSEKRKWSKKGGRKRTMEGGGRAKLEQQQEEQPDADAAHPVPRG